MGDNNALFSGVNAEKIQTSHMRRNGIIKIPDVQCLMNSTFLGGLALKIPVNAQKLCDFNHRKVLLKSDTRLH